MNAVNTISRVEKTALEHSKREFIYSPTEKIGIIQVDNFPLLGKLTALRFIEWIQANPGGVVSLPTGKTPEHFIKFVIRYLRGWHKPSIQKDLEINGVDPSIKPDMASLHFIQIDEFYPIDPNQKNSFYYYVKKFYIDGFGLDPVKALLMNFAEVGVPAHLTLKDVFPDGVVDLSLRHRHPVDLSEQRQKSVIEAVDEFCTQYEEKIQNLGGIGFFLGGIGPDGHIAFNIRGSDHFSTTRLTQTNYETQAAAASDLGGIEISRNRLVVTIGLKTITVNPKAVVIIIAAGEAKAKIVADAIESPKSILYPASILQDLPNARFYLTRGAACRLVERRLVDFQSWSDLPADQIDRVLIDLAVRKNKMLVDLTKNDLLDDKFGQEILRRYRDDYHSVILRTRDALIAKIEAGLKDVSNTAFMHTAPTTMILNSDIYPIFIIW
ncbi:MAG: hypothetical protein EHM72_14860 [Calditrichaeota bacterium]|nr:MAG: hypothetical protein EHM72_14860 [Calditrichota bacterium]